MANGNGRKSKAQAPQLPNPTPGFDVGFQLAPMNNLENQLGKAAIDTESTMEALQNGMEANITQAQTNTSLNQTTMQDQLHGSLQQAQQATTLLQQHLEGNLAAVAGKSVELSANVAPTHPFVQQVQQAIQAPLVAGNPNSFGSPQTPAGGGAVSGCPWSGVIPDDKWSLGQEPQAWEGKSITCNGWTTNFMGCNPSSDPPTIGYTSFDGRGNSFSGILPFGGACTPPTPIPPTPTPIPTPVPPPGPGVPPVPGQVCPPPPPPKECCQPTPCPAPQVIVNNIIEEKKPPYPTPKKKYCGWCTPDGIVYIIYEGDSPRNSADRLLSCETSPLELNLANCCGTAVVPPSPSPGPRPPIPSPSGFDIPPSPDSWQFAQGTGCDNLWNFPYMVNPPNAGFFKSAQLAAEGSEGGKAGNLSIADQIGEAIKNTLVDVIGILPATAFTLARSLALALPCASTSQGQIEAARVAIGLISKYVSSVFDHDDAALEYEQSFNCPWKLPSAEQAVQQYLSNTITLDRLICLVKANGYKWDSFKPTVEANRTRLTTFETLGLWRRKEITDAQKDDYLRQLGYVYPGERDGLSKLTDQIPPVSDIISMMLRDVADEKNIDWSESDRIFGDKWAGQLQKWGDNQGIGETYAKYLWRAHWRLPSPTQLSEFWQRLRGNQKFNGDGKLEEKIRQVLLQDDYHPNWVDHYMAVINRPLTRIDARRAFEVGTLNNQGLKDVFIQLGYTDENADTLVKFSERQLIERYKKSSYVNSYAAGEISASELDQQLRDIGLNSNVVQPVMQYATFKLTLNRRKACVKSYKKRYLTGELNINDATSQLASSGLDPTQVAEISKAWQCEKDQRGKAVGASVLCGWYERGVIDELDMYNRLRNLNYDEDDATKLVRDCMIRVGIKLDKAAQAKMQLAQRQQRQSQAAARQLARQLQKGSSTPPPSPTKAQAAREARQKKIITMGESWATKLNIGLADGIIQIRKVVDQALANGIAPANTIYTAVEAGVKDPSVGSVAALANEVANLLVDVG